MESAIPVLAVLVGILAILQGWQMVAARRNKKHGNPGYEIQNGHIKKLEEISGKLDTMNNSLGRMEQRGNDIWNKVK